MNWKGCGRKWLWPNLRYYPGICLEELRKTTKNLSQDSQSLGRGLNPGPPGLTHEACLNNTHSRIVLGGRMETVKSSSHGR
jgi:hypothetical protein